MKDEMFSRTTRIGPPATEVFAWRQETAKADLKLAIRDGGVGPRRVLIAGASGLMGRTLAAFLRAQGHTVVGLVRRAPRNADEVSWNPAAGEIDVVAIEGVDVIVNLAGENVGAGRWTVARRAAILRSRIDATQALVHAVQRLRRKPEVFLNASAVGFYGDRGGEVLTEASGSGRGFLPAVCREWEAQAEGAAQAGSRAAWLRFGVVLTPAGGALAKLLPVFRAGFGGRIGCGTQWMSWVSVDDAVGAIYHAMVTPECRGALNVVAPEPVTNAEFTATLARVVRRPAAVPVPAGLLRLVLGEMADEMLLASARAVPERLQETGFGFRHATLEVALRHVLGE